MGKNKGLVVIAALLLTGCATGESETVPPIQSAAEIETTHSENASYVDAIRPLLETHDGTSDIWLITEGFRACADLAFNGKDAYVDGLMELPVTVRLDKAVIAAGAANYLCPGVVSE